MPTINSKLKDYLQTLDKGSKRKAAYNEEFQIADHIKKILREDEGYQPNKFDLSEQEAFDFMEKYPNDSNWGTYHGPMIVSFTKDGEHVEYPSIRKIDAEILEYWELRSSKSQNPILSYRYANLVTDFAQFAKYKAKIESFRLVIDSAIAICQSNLADELDCQTKIKQALILAIRIKDTERIKKVKDIIILLDNNATNDDSPGLWGFAVKWLILDSAISKGVSITDSERDSLILDLESRLARVKGDTWLAECAVSSLAEYYAKEKNEEDLMRVLEVLETSIKADEHTNSDALIKYSNYQQIQEVYQKYASRFQLAAKANNRMTQEIAHLDLDWGKSLKEIKVDIKFPAEKRNVFLKQVFGEDENAGISRAILGIAYENLPTKKNIQSSFERDTQKHPLNYLEFPHFFHDRMLHRHVGNKLNCRSENGLPVLPS